jgi:predicted RNA-binding Zn ribbon-like protein
MTNQQELDKPDGKFFFVSGFLAIDLVNTEIVVRGKRQDLLKTAADLQEWAALAGQHVYVHETAKLFTNNQDEFDAKLLKAIQELRAGLRQTLGAKVNNETNPDSWSYLPELNHLLSYGTHALRANGEGALLNGYELKPGVSPLLFQTGLSALSLFSKSDLSRLHKCQNARCILFFYDTTKSATRQWCSFGCMNRARSSQHYRETKNKVGLPG